MKSSGKQTHAFTLAEMIIAAAVSVILSVGFMIYTSSALRMMIRNLATNHSHETARASLDRVLSQVHNSADRFQLINFDGTNYSDVTATVSSDADSLSQQYISNRANGVRFMIAAGGPFKVVGDGNGNSTVASNATTVQFDFGTSGYTPLVGDKVQFPLLSREFDIVAGTSPATPAKSGTLWTVTLSGQIGNSLTTGTGFITTAIFYHRVGYFVLNNQLIYDPGYPPPPYPTKPVSAFPYDAVPTPPKQQMAVIKTNVTSPKPFSLLFPTATSTITDGLNLRVSLESYDLQYSSHILQDGTTTLQAVMPSRNRPPVLSTN